jgi:HAE1 family hydrophobic/amphiphilic exporter-1
MTLPELAIRRPVTTAMILVSLGVLGTVALGKMPLAHLPEMDEPEIFVRFPYPDASPEQVERMIVRPAEEAIASVRGLKKMWSRCGGEGATIRLEFGWGADIKLAQVETLEKLDRIRRDLPTDLEDISVGTHWNNREADSPVLEVRVSSDLDLTESYDRLDRRIVRVLQRVPGVAQVRLDGVSPNEVRINLKLAALELHRIDRREVYRILRASNFDLSLGRIRGEEMSFDLRSLGSFRSIDEIRDLPVRADGLRLSDVADVVYGQPEVTFGRHLDGRTAIGLTVSAESKANVVEVSRTLRERLATLGNDPELAGIKFLVWFDQGEEIERTLAGLFSAGVFGAILASIVLFVFLERISTTLIAVLCIPFSLVITCGIIWAQGEAINTLSLLGLIVGVGMLVDNAVVVIENIFRHQELGEDQRRAAYVGSREVSIAVIAATLTSVIVFLPTLFNKPNAMTIPLRAIGLPVCFTLLASLFVSQTLIPLATSTLIRPKFAPRRRWMLFLERVYDRVLAFHLRHRSITPIVVLALTASVWYPFQKTEINFEMERPSLFAQISYRFSEDVPIEEKERIVTLLEKRIHERREELDCQSTYSWWSDSFSMTRVYLPEGAATPENLAILRERLRKSLPSIPGVRLDIEDGRRSWRQDRGKRVAVMLLGDESEVLGRLATEVRARIEKIPGLEDSFASNHQTGQEVHVLVDRNLASRYDVRSTELADAVGLTFRGRRLPRYRSPDGEREMRLMLDEQEDESLEQLQNLLVPTRTGARVPLAALADVPKVPGYERIERENRLTTVWVGANYTKGVKEEYFPAVTEALNGMEFPHGYSWSFGDALERRREQSLDFAINIGLALLLVFALMAGLFESTRQAIALMISLPFALSGAYWSLWFAGLNFDQPAAVGLLLLIGVVVNNGIVMIEHVNGYRRAGMSRDEALAKGCRERLRPILMTALTTLLGLLPMAIQKPALGGMYYYSMSYVLMGGIALSTILTLVYLPTAVCLVEDACDLVGRFARSAVGLVTPRRRPPANSQGSAIAP